MSNKNNPLVFLDVSIDGDPLERMLFELFSDVVPKTAENFRALCTGEKGVSPKCGKPLHYKGSFFHQIVKGSVAQGGDFLKRDGSYGESIYGGKFPDESPKLKHDGPGLLSMAIADRDSRGSLFTITFTANHYLDRKYIVFGKLVQGHEVLKKIENAGDDEGRPTVTVKIVNSGEFHDTENQSSDKRDASTLKTEKHKKSFKERRIKRRSPTEFFESDSDSDSSDRIDQDSSNRLNSEAQESTGVNMIPSTAIKKQLINQNPPISTPISPKRNLKCNILASKPFGLHSNNDSRPIASLISPPKGYLYTLEKQNVNINTTYGPSPLSENLKPLNNTLFIEKPGIKRNSEDSGKKERRKASGTNNRSVCCKCSRSQCLKRYCECFAAEMFCANSCTCQGCQNVKENEDMVTEAKEQVESRNPQAFSPKTEGGNRLTASSARNKRFCNCKKSMCLKKYCDCYKSGHGCSDGCRCEGCRNINGTKQECLAGKRTVSTKAEGENLEAAAYNEKLEMALTGVDFLQNNLVDPQNLTSSTFPFQYSYHGEDASKTQFHFGGFPAQDYTNLVILNQYLLPPSNSNTHTIDFQGEPNYNTTTSDQLNEFSQRDVNNDTGSQLYHQLSSSRFPSSDSLNLINSPILNQTNSFTMIKQIELVEDEMPKILKEEQKGVKASSPNKKRISPPLMESGGSSFDDSGSALRSGRKFILPYVPPGPYSGPTDESTNYPQGYSSN